MEHPFNLKGKIWFFGGGAKLLSANLMEKTISVSDMGRKKYIHVEPSRPQIGQKLEKQKYAPQLK